MVPQPLRAATPATPIQSRLLHELGILRNSPNLEMVWSAPFQRSRAAERTAERLRLRPSSRATFDDLHATE